MHGAMQTKVEFLKKLPSPARLAEALAFKPEKFLLVYDRQLAKSKGFREWLKEYPHAYPVKSGESLRGPCVGWKIPMALRTSPSIWRGAS